MGMCLQLSGGDGCVCVGGGEKTMSSGVCFWYNAVTWKFVSSPGRADMTSEM